MCVHQAVSVAVAAAAAAAWPTAGVHAASVAVGPCSCHHQLPPADALPAGGAAFVLACGATLAYACLNGVASMLFCSKARALFSHKLQPHGAAPL